MTVAELLAHVRDLPPDTRVVVDGYEGGLDDPSIGIAEIALDVNTSEWWMGRHRTKGDGDEPATVVRAVVLSR